MYVSKRLYEVHTLGYADDLADADGVNVLDFWQAQDKEHKKKTRGDASNECGPVTARAITTKRGARRQAYILAL
jgi:hypothetical protein